MDELLAAAGDNLQEVALEAAKDGNWRVVARVLTRGDIALDESGKELVSECAGAVPACGFIWTLVSLDENLMHKSAQVWLRQLASMDSEKIDTNTLIEAMKACFPGDGTVRSACVPKDSRLPNYLERAN